MINSKQFKELLNIKYQPVIFPTNQSLTHFQELHSILVAWRFIYKEIGSK